jgi:hypothetical protein
MISRLLGLLFGKKSSPLPFKERCPWCRAAVRHRGRPECEWCGHELERSEMYEGEWIDYMDRKVAVTVAFHDGLWAVTVNEDPEFWLNAFEDPDEAGRFCQENGLPYEVER